MFSFNDSISSYIQKILELPNFCDSHVQMRTRLLWLCPVWKHSEKSEVQKNWPESLLVKGTFPASWFLDDCQDPDPDPISAKVRINLDDPDALSPLKSIESNLSSAIIFSENRSTDIRLPILISLIRLHFPGINITTECSAPEYMPYLYEAGADEVFSRRKINNRIILSALLDTNVPYFIGEILNRQNNNLGIKSSSLDSLRLTVQKNTIFKLGADVWPAFEEISLDEKIQYVAAFRRFKNRFCVEPLIKNVEMDFIDNDCLLFLTPNQEASNRFQSSLTNLITKYSVPI
jgi:hypothetical protein